MTEMFWPVVIFMAISLAIGLYTYTQVKGSSERYTVCGKSMPFLVVGTALLAQAVDGNATLGNVSLVWSSNVWGGLLIPLGLAVSLVVVGKYLAAPLNEMDLMTLPEFFYRRYGKRTELLVSVVTMVCFTVLIAGNLSAVAWILSVVSGLGYGQALLISTAVILAYTIAGGLYSAIWTDFFQIHVALAGFVGAAVYLISTHGTGPLTQAAAAGKLDLAPLTKLASGALPNWAGFLSLAIGNAMALDFMERVFSAKSGKTARNACYYAAGLTLVVGACATLMGLYSVSIVPKIDDPRMVLPALAGSALPFWVGVMVFIGVLGASMSTANGAMLVMSVVAARSLYERYRETPVSDAQMLTLSRLMAIPTAAAACGLAYVKPEPGILLVIAFDIVFAGCVVPLFFGVHSKRATSEAAVTAITVGTLSRLVAHFVTPPEWAGLDTLIPPALSFVSFVTVMKLGRRAELPAPAAAHGD
jgi:solute:Na+ symporter, SSS family